MFYNSNLKTREDVEILLQEIQAYRELDSAEFDFNGQIIRNTGECNLGTEDAYYEIDIQELEDILSSSDVVSIKSTNRKNKLNAYERKMYHKKNKHLLKIKNHSPWYTYGHDWGTDGIKYWKRYYVQCKELRKTGDRTIRNIRPGKEDFPLKGKGYRKVYDYWWDIF